jgi:hypothetical protein
VYFANRNGNFDIYAKARSGGSFGDQARIIWSDGFDIPVATADSSGRVWVAWEVWRCWPQSSIERASPGRPSSRPRRRAIGIPLSRLHPRRSRRCLGHLRQAITISASMPPSRWASRFRWPPPHDSTKTEADAPRHAPDAQMLYEYLRKYDGILASKAGQRSEGRTGSGDLSGLRFQSDFRPNSDNHSCKCSADYCSSGRIGIGFLFTRS